jgi:hypothetical protein
MVHNLVSFPAIPDVIVIALTLQIMFCDKFKQYKKPYIAIYLKIPTYNVGRDRCSWIGCSLFRNWKTGCGRRGLRA